MLLRGWDSFGLIPSFFKTLQENFNMKKFIVVALAIVLSITANAQSFQYHQGYDFKSKSAAQKFIADFFWTSENGKWNIFSWNNFGVNYNGTNPGSTDATALLYAEYMLGNSNFYIHPEVRFNTWCENYYQFGFAYLLPFKDLAIYLTPKYSYHGRHDFQFSINSSYENDWFYHEGYIDTDWVPAPTVYTNEGPSFIDSSVYASYVPKAEYSMGFFAEEKFYWKATKHFHVGLNLVIGGDTKNGFSVIAPMFVARVSLY